MLLDNGLKLGVVQEELVEPGEPTSWTWMKSGGIALDEVESAVVGQLRTPLNLDKAGKPRDRLRKGQEAIGGPCSCLDTVRLNGSDGADRASTFAAKSRTSPRRTFDIFVVRASQGR